MIYDAAALAFLATGAPVHTEIAVRVDSRNRSTQALERNDFWTGLEPATYTIDGASRTLQPAYGILEVGELVAEAGLDIQVSRLSLSMDVAAAETLFLGYDPDQAPIQVHVLLFDAARAFQGAGRVISGQVDRTPIDRAAGNAGHRVTVEIESTTRLGTRPLASTKSDPSQRERNAADAGRKYSDLQTDVLVKWGNDGGGDNYWVRSSDRAGARR